MRTQLTHIDRAIARLLDERARVCAAASDPRACSPSIDDLLKRADGDFDAALLRQVFEVVGRGAEGGEAR